MKQGKLKKSLKGASRAKAGGEEVLFEFFQLEYDVTNCFIFTQKQDPKH